MRIIAGRPMLLRAAAVFTGLALWWPLLARPVSVDPGSFVTDAKFSVDRAVMSMSTAVATIEPRRGAPGYSWLRINFYSFPVTVEDLPGILNGDVRSMDKKWNQKSGNPAEYNRSNSVIQLYVDQQFKVWQVDMAVPGHTCTIAPFERDVASFLQNYKFDGRRLKLKTQVSYICDMKFMGIANQTFGWDMNLDVPVFPKQSSKSQ